MAELAIFERNYPFKAQEAKMLTMSFDAPNTGSTEFREVFTAHFRQLHGYAISFLKDHDDAEEVVQNVFFKLWSNKGGLMVPGSVVAYLYTAVHNECLNFLKHQRVRMQHQARVLSMAKTSITAETDILVEKELKERIMTAINELPVQCRTVFEMSRYQNLKYSDISKQLGISVKTVENHMGKALRVLREKLAEYLPLTILLLNI